MNPLSAYREYSVSLAIERARKEDARLFFKKYRSRLSERSCPACGSTHRTSQPSYAEAFKICKCMACSLVYCPILLPPEGLTEYYNDSKSARLLNTFYKERNKNNKNSVSKSRLDIAEKLCKEMINAKPGKLKILEIGCGTGAFLKALETRLLSSNLEVDSSGIEPNRDCQRAMKMQGIRLAGGLIEEIEASLHHEAYDLILCFELIEHLYEPRQTMDSLHVLLKPGGKIVLTTPNIEGLDNAARDYNDLGLLAHAVCPPAHMQGFSRVTLGLLARITGFNIESINAKGMFDVYAVDQYIRNKSTSIDEILKIKQLLRFSNGNAMENTAIRRDDLDEDTMGCLQDVVNLLNASSTITATLWKG